MRHDRIIDAFGGNTALSLLIGRSHSAISRWRDNGIPPQFWPLIVDLAEAQARRLRSDSAFRPGDADCFDEITMEELRAGLPRDSRYRVGTRPARSVA